MKLPLEIGKYYKDGFGNVLLMKPYYHSDYKDPTHGAPVFGEVVFSVNYRGSDMTIHSQWSYWQATGHFGGAGPYGPYHLIEGPFDSVEETNVLPVVYAWTKPTPAQRALILD